MGSEQSNISTEIHTEPPQDGLIEDVPVVDDIQDDIPDEPPAVIQDEPGAPDTQDEIVPDKPKRKRVSKYLVVSKASFADTLSLQGDVYTAPLSTPFNILSPTVTLMTDLIDADGEYSQYATLKLKRTHANLFHDVEETLLKTAKKNKVAWFGNESIGDEFLETSLKRFVDVDAKTLTVKIDEGLGGKTDIQVGTKIKCVLSAQHAIFTRTQYGVPFTLELIKSVEKDETAYLFDPEEDETFRHVTGTDLMTHLNACDEIADQL